MSSSRLCIAAICLTASALAHAELKVISEGKASQIRTDELVVHSERVGREFLVEVTLLDQARPDRKYAAVYAVDGGLGVAGPASRLIVAGQRTVPFFVVSIGYANSFGRYLGPRNTDLVHRRVKIEGREVGGGGAAFEAFILEELRPYLERRYPLDPQRAVLLGHSGGGLFAATVLVTNPEAFAGYVIGGVPLLYDSPLPQQAKAVAPRGRGQRVFIGFTPGDARNTGSDGFTASLTGPESKFKVREERFEEETHNSEYLQLLARGLPFVLPTETAELVAISVAPEILDRYVGAYRIDARQTINISRNGKEFLGQVNEGSRYPLLAETPTRFFSREVDAIVTFEPPVGGKSPSLVMRRSGVESTAKRTN